MDENNMGCRFIPSAHNHLFTLTT